MPASKPAPASRSDRTIRNADSDPRVQIVTRPDDKTPQAASRANEIVRVLGLPPITGLSGPRIGY